MLSEPHKLFKLIWQKKKCFFYSAFCPCNVFLAIATNIPVLLWLILWSRVTHLF